MLHNRHFDYSQLAHGIAGPGSFNSVSHVGDIPVADQSLDSPDQVGNSPVAAFHGLDISYQVANKPADHQAAYISVVALAANAAD